MSVIAQIYEKYCEERFSLPTEKQVADIERRMGVPFPADFREYVLRYNGGLFNEPDILPHQKECPLDRLAELYGLGANAGSEELASPDSLAMFDDNDPPQILPIGYTMMGCLLYMVIDPEGDDCGQVSIKLPNSDRCYFLGKGIEEFFTRLREPDEALTSKYGTLFD
jgi:hypothetical protein